VEENGAASEEFQLGLGGRRLRGEGDDDWGDRWTRDRARIAARAIAARARSWIRVVIGDCIFF
jgi:hypothetical protein